MRSRLPIAAVIAAIALTVAVTIAVSSQRHPEAREAPTQSLPAQALSPALLASAPPAPARPTRVTVAAPPAVDARSVMVIDMARGETLYELDADEVIPPASLTKIMSMMVALDAVEKGRIALDDRVAITRADVTLPYRSSLMYLREGMNVPLDDLLRGMAVVSGNDAAITVARVLGGSSDGFAELMNAEAARLGLSVTRVVEPSGLSEHNLTTAREMSVLARSYLLRNPEALGSYHSRTSLHFPRADVMPQGQPEPEPRIVLRATNRLLASYEGCDGLKTGYIDESGYNLVATAERDGTRFIVVTLGGSGGQLSRERSGRALLDWAFASFRTVRPEAPEPKAPRVWGGATPRVAVRYAEPTVFTVPRELSRNVTARLESWTEVEAPIQAGDRLGRAVFVSGDAVVRRVDLVAAEDVPLGNLFIRAKDALERLARRALKKPA